MKNLINQFCNAAIVCCFVCAAFGVDAQIVNIPDANFKAALVSGLCKDTNNDGIGDANVDTNGDGEIQVSEAVAVTSLIVSNKNITDFTPIRFFNRLQYLDCRFNQITSLNTNGLPSLAYLYCSNNQLTSLNVLGAPGLISLYCDNNQLSNLNVQNMSNLYYLHCNYNSLGSLNVQNLNNLEELECEHNQLSALNVQGLNKLRSLCLSYNQLTSLNVQGLRSLIYCVVYNNQISTLNIQGLTTLQYLYCGINKLISLDVQSLTKLQYFDCHTNSLSSLNVQGLNDLIWFDCRQNQLTTLNVETVNNLHDLFCNRNPIQCLSPLPNSLLHLNTDTTNITCLPNRPLFLTTGSGAALPVCQAGNTNNCYVATTNAAASANAALRVSPNPMHDATTFELTDTSALGSANTATLVVYNALGQAVRTVSFEGNKCTFTRDALPAGCYFYSVQLGAEVLNKGKLVIE